MTSDPTVPRSVSVTVVVPTFRRERDAADQAERFAGMTMVARVLVVDQGSTLATYEPFIELRRREAKIELIDQPNLGGSGGYARGMLESLTSPEHAVYLSDDDAQISEESLALMLAHQGQADRPTIVGTAMYAADDPELQISGPEAVRGADFMWGPAGDASPNYTGWWGTLLPPGTVAELGLPAPYFLKWDDAEYGLRATRAGYDTVVPPGANVWHPTWNAFATQMSWTARILHRNRLATAAACGAGRGVIRSSLLHQGKHILAGHHLTATLWAAGIDQFLAGPGTWLGRDLTHARADGQRVVEGWNEDHLEVATDLAVTHAGPLPAARAAVRALANLVGPARPPRIVCELPADEVTWRTTLGADAVIVTGPDGSRAGTLIADGPTARRLLATTLRQHWALARRWRQLCRSYHRALPKVTTRAAWERMIAAAEEAERPAKDD
ncbi:glycosyltransferase [Pseudactinotalea sp. HY158]|uniref:glycosyltransferase n=1 Tax=Pseudactinotalea sp. HY158 TaxID=2654547 RepID=UPI00129D103B|nr:glycosyltransferase [Pseudactinotalea sp. HY158]QGH70074.1 glycosyltransferase [Pseudactinotalea sp. HY158]